ncbi:MAG: lysophospholipid acyltransferase family protein [Elusimicrobiales bacterium]|nr:lysophospholipid acyltransferase family protein [Elusimicrobiales bacterium]
MKLKETAHKLIVKIIGPLGAAALRLIMRLSRIETIGRRPEKNEQPFIYALWHNRQLLHIGIHRDEGLHTLASASRDGDYISAVLENLGYSVARGSTDTNKSNYKKSLTAARSLMRALKAGKTIAITVDGPLGPKYSVQEGAIFLARITGCPIVPIASAASISIKLKTWDRLEIPMPFSRIKAVFGKPYRISKNADQKEEAQILQKKLLDLTEKAENMLKQ